MNVFEEYKPIRNKIGLLAVDDALGVIWAYCQFLQLDNFTFPKSIEVLPSFLHDEFPQRFVSEWELELLAKEIILNGGPVARKGRSLRTWNTLSEIVNSIKDIENRIYGHFGSPDKVLFELSRIAHRQFLWQMKPINSASTIRYYKIFNRPGIDEICRETIGLTVWQIFMCGTAVMGALLNRPAISTPFKNQINGLSIDNFEKFFAFTSKPIADLKTALKAGQQYNSDFAYAYNCLRTYPLVRMTYGDSDCYVCPLLTLLFWKFTGGLYYELIGHPKFGNEFGDGFQQYVGEVIDKTASSKMDKFGEQPYWIGKLEKKPVDWIVADEHSALFLECKAKRLSWGAKASSSDTAHLEADIDSMASAVVQIYKTLNDHLNGLYTHFPFKEGRKIFPAVVTLENWRLFGSLMLTKLNDAVKVKLEAVCLPSHYLTDMPYSVFAIEELEIALQLMGVEGIGNFIDGKTSFSDKQQWDWTGYMNERYKGSKPARRLFQNEHDEMFSDLYRAQRA
jgi:hypothetical protein